MSKKKKRTINIDPYDVNTVFNASNNKVALIFENENKIINIKIDVNWICHITDCLADVIKKHRKKNEVLLADSIEPFKKLEEPK